MIIKVKWSYPFSTLKTNKKNSSSSTVSYSLPSTFLNMMILKKEKKKERWSNYSCLSLPYFQLYNKWCKLNTYLMFEINIHVYFDGTAGHLVIICLTFSEKQKVKKSQCYLGDILMVYWFKLIFVFLYNELCRNVIHAFYLFPKMNVNLPFTTKHTWE